MPAKHCTSKKYKKPGVFVDYSSATTQSNTAFLQSLRAKKYQQIRNGSKKHSAQPNGSKVKQQEDDEDDGEEAADDNDNNAEADGESSPPSELITPEGLSISLAPFNPSTASSSTFKASHSACATSTAESSLSDDKILGAALYEWLLSKEGWDCHALWEKFLLEWDLVTETERPPGTNRPLNLHGYLTGFRNTNNKHGARTQIKTVRDTLKMERAVAIRDAPDDPFSKLNQQALNGSLLMYYLKTKGLIPYESENQKKKKMAQQMKRKRDETAEEADDADDEVAKGESKEADEESEEEADAPSTSKQQPAKKTKVSHTGVIGSSSNQKPQSSSSKPNHTASAASKPSAPSLKLGQANAFAALFDCDD